MGQSYPLDRIVREVSSKYKTKSDDQELVIIQINERFEKKVLDKKPLFGNAKFYVVSNIKDARNIAECEGPLCSIKHFDESIELDTKYQVSCKPGNERQVALSLCGNIHPTAELNDKIEKWINEYVHKIGIAEFMRNYYEEIPFLIEHAEQQAIEETGLTLTLRVLLKREHELVVHDTYTIKDDLIIWAADYDREEQYISLEIDLAVFNDDKINAVRSLKELPILEEKVKNHLKMYFRQNISLQTIYFDLTDNELKNRIITDLQTSVLKGKGRRIGRLSLKLKNDISSIQTFIDKEKISIPCVIDEYPENVLIDNRLQMELEDVSKFKLNMNNIPINQWLEINLKEIIHKQLFGIKYIDLLLKFDPYKEAIKVELEERASLIGYKIKHLITTPDLEPLNWQEKIKINFKEKYQTQIPGFFVEFSVELQTKIPNLNKIKEALNRRDNIPGLIQDEVSTVIRRHLSSIHPERIYFRFDSKADYENLSLKEEMDADIREKLDTVFHAKMIYLSIILQEDEIINHFNSLQQELGYFAVKIVSVQDKMPIDYKGQFRVEGVHPELDSWEKFFKRKVNMEGIKDYIEAFVNSRFGAFSTEDLAYEDYNELIITEKTIKKLVSDSILDEFGLVINVRNLSRGYTINEVIEIEKNNADMENARKLITKFSEVTDEKIKNDLIDLKNFLDKRSKLILQEDTEDEIFLLDQKIKNISESIEPFFKKDDDLLKPNISTTKKPKLRDIARRENIIANNEYNLLSEPSEEEEAK